MTRLRSIGCVAVAAAALLAGCGGSSSSGTEKLQLSSFVAGAADTVCSALAKCGCSDSSAVTSCKQAYVSSMTDALGYELMRYPGRTIDPAAAQTCLDGVKAELADCSVTPAAAGLVGISMGPMGANLPGCDMTTVFQALQAAGEPCRDDIECVAGLACDQGTRTCGTPAAPSGDCSYVRCVDTAYCASGDTCAAKLAAGDTCSSSGDYWDQPQCGAGLQCEFSLSLTHYVCVAPVAVGGSCSDGQPCVAGAHCDSGTTQCTADLADGASCTSYQQCTRHFCNSQGKCADPGICSASGVILM